MKYIFITFTGYSLPIAKQLMDEGNDVVVGMIQDASDLDVEGWQSKQETPEEKKRRLSLYDGIIEKLSANNLLRTMQYNKDRLAKVDDYFVVVDHNNLCKYGDRIIKMGYTGFIPNTEDYEREKDRQAAHAFVKKHYPHVKVLASKTLQRAEEGIKLVEDSDNLWVLKSNGNLAETIVPRTTDVALNHAQIVGALKRDGKDYEKGGYLLEEKIVNPIEFTPELAFWNAEPIYSQVEIECKPLGAGDVGPDGGGAINLVIKTEVDDKINTTFFPKIVNQMAKKRAGLFIFDAGILYNPANDTYYFTEFAGNRWSWGGVFSELSMATKNGRTASNYFEAVASGADPLANRYGVTVSLYNILPDGDFPSLKSQGIPVYWDEKRRTNMYFYQLKQVKGGEYENVGCDDLLFCYAGGYGNSLSGAVNMAYRAVDGISLKEVVYRAKSDYLSRKYPSAILNRLEFLARRYPDSENFTT